MTELQTTRTLDVVAAEIRTFTASLLNNVIEIGRRLCEAKEMLPYGEFGQWVRENTAYSVSSANNFMRLFNEYGAAQGCLFGAEAESQTFGKLSYSKALALLAVPAEEREEFVETHDVEAMSTRELAEAIRERDEAVAKAEAVEQLRADAVKDVENLERYNAELDEKLAEAKDRIEELERRPVEVAVAEPDPEEIKKRVDDAVAEAMKEAKAKAAEEKKKLKDKLSAAEEARKKIEAEAEKLRQDAADKDKRLEEKAGMTPEEKERLEREIENMRKQLAMSDEAVTTFKTLFDQWRRLFAQMTEHLHGMADAETAAKLRAALRKQTEAYAQAAEEAHNGE